MRRVFGKAIIVGAIVSPTTGFVLAVTDDLIIDGASPLYDLKLWIGKSIENFKPGIYRIALASPDGKSFLVGQSTKIMDL